MGSNDELDNVSAKRTNELPKRPWSSPDRQLTTKGEAAANQVHDEFATDLIYLAKIQAKNQGATVIDEQHIFLARQQLAPKPEPEPEPEPPHLKAVKWGAKGCTLLAGAILGYLVQAFVSPPTDIDPRILIIISLVASVMGLFGILYEK